MKVKTLAVKLCEDVLQAARELDKVTNEFADTHHIVAFSGINILPPIYNSPSMLTRTVSYQEEYDENP